MIVYDIIIYEQRDVLIFDKINLTEEEMLIVKELIFNLTSKIECVRFLVIEITQKQR